MDTDILAQSPNNDSGISPGHGSNGSASAGQSSPSQNGPLSSPEQHNSEALNHEFNTEKMQRISFYNDQNTLNNDMARYWGISKALQNAYNTNTAENQIPPTTTPLIHYGYQRNYHPLSPKSNNERSQLSTPKPLGKHTFPLTSNRSPGKHRNNEPASPTLPMSEVRMPPGFNPGLSDDNNTLSSTCSSPDSIINENENMLGMNAEQNPLQCLQLTVEQATIMDETGQMSSEQGANGARNIFQCIFCDFKTIIR